MIEVGDTVEITKHDDLKGYVGVVEEIFTTYISVKFEGRPLPVLIDSKSVKKIVKED